MAAPLPGSPFMTPRPLLALSLAILAAGCTQAASSALVIPYQDGRYTSVASAADEKDALRAAVAGAKQECAGQKKALAVGKSSTRYKGVLTPELTKTVKQIDRIINQPGASPLPDLSDDEDYEVTVEFRCS